MIVQRAKLNKPMKVSKLSSKDVMGDKLSAPEPSKIDEKLDDKNRSCYICNFCEQTGSKAGLIAHQINCVFRRVMFKYKFYCAKCKHTFDFYRAYFEHCAINCDRDCSTNFMYVCRDSRCIDKVFTTKASIDRHIDSQSHGSKNAGASKYAIGKFIRNSQDFYSFV